MEVAVIRVSNCAAFNCGLWALSSTLATPLSSLTTIVQVSASAQAQLNCVAPHHCLSSAIPKFRKNVKLANKVHELSHAL
jgi:hypothetical protein